MKEVEKVIIGEVEFGKQAIDEMIDTVDSRGWQHIVSIMASVHKADCVGALLFRDPEIDSGKWHDVLVMAAGKAELIECFMDLRDGIHAASKELTEASVTE